jgi:sugar lactone lactonase YvrE
MTWICRTSTLQADVGSDPRSVRMSAVGASLLSAMMALSACQGTEATNEMGIGGNPVDTGFIGNTVKVGSSAGTSATGQAGQTGQAGRASSTNANSAAIAAGSGGQAGSIAKGGTDFDASVDASRAIADDGSAETAASDTNKLDHAEAGVDVQITPCDDCCADGLPRGTAASSTKPRLVASFTPSPEGVTVCPNGDVFVALSSGGEIRRVSVENGTSEIWATLAGTQLAGLSCDDKGRLFAAQYGGTPTPPQVWMVTAKNAAAVPLPSPTGGAALQNLNGIVAVKGLGVYASDSTGNLILHYTETSAGKFSSKIAAGDVAGANGLVYDANAKKLYVGASLNNKVVSLTVTADGALESRKDLWTGPDLLGWADGTAVDESGKVYVAYYLASPGAIIRVSDKKTVATIEGGSPGSIAFRGGTLLITDYKLTADTEGGLYAIDLGVCGASRF